MFSLLRVEVEINIKRIKKHIIFQLTSNLPRHNLSHKNLWYKLKEQRMTASTPPKPYVFNSSAENKYTFKSRFTCFQF